MEAFRADPQVTEWHNHIKRFKSRAKIYRQFVWQYYQSWLVPGGWGIKTWLEEVKSQLKSTENKDRTAWARDLEQFVTSYVSPVTSETYTAKTRKVFVTSIKDFLIFHLGELPDYSFELTTSEERVKETKHDEQML